MDLARFDDVELLPAAASYRAQIDSETIAQGWDVAATVTTIFLEGTEYERGELDPSAPKRPAAPLEEHPLVRHYGLSLEHLALTKAHRKVEGDHRRSAWRVVLDFVGEGARVRVVDAMQRALEAWLAYRDDVARACGVER
jgi:pyrroloquinoline-quinone synthase